MPKEWAVRAAYIEDEAGNRIIDMADTNLHVLGYSTPIDKWVDLDELKSHIFTLPDQPEIIPYVTSYYKERYGFCMSQNQLDSLKPGKYHMYIDSELFDGNLTYAELVLPGESDKEIFFSTYIATDNHLKHMKQHIVAGFNMSCVGDDRDYSIVHSKYADTLADRVLTNVLKSHTEGKFSDYSFLKRGSDERQYNSAGVDLPVVCFCRSKFGEYPEYHTSADDMTLASHSLGNADFSLQSAKKAAMMQLWP